MYDPDEEDVEWMAFALTNLFDEDEDEEEEVDEADHDEIA